MTPKEKAEELVNKYWEYLRADLMYAEDAKEDAIQCSLIAVDEILSEFMFADSDYSNRRYKYYQEVKKELEEMK